jgi:hypothetical protein
MDERPRPRREIEPIYQYVGRPRPKGLDPDAKWMRALSIPRYLAKTYVSLVWCLQLILRNPDVRIAYHCNEKDMAEEGVALVRDWLDLPQIVQLYGSHKGNRWSAKGFVSGQRTVPHKDPTMRPIGLDKPLEGKRAHVFVWDDLIGLDSYNPNGVIKAEKRLAACRPLIIPGGIGLYVCTRWGIADPMSSGKTFGGNPGILKKWADGEWDCFGHRGSVSCYAYPGDEELFPYIMEEDHPEDASGRKLLFPSIWNELAIEAERREMPFGLFASQVMNDPMPEESIRFRDTDMQYFELFEEETA